MGTGTIARNSAWYAFDIGANMLAGIVISIAVARALGPAKLGYFNYVMWLAGITGLIATFGVPAATRKYVAEYLGKGQAGVATAIIRATFRIQSLTAAVIASAGLAAVMLWTPAEQRLYTALAVASLVPFLLMAIPTAVNMAAENFRANVIPSLAATAANAAGVALTLIYGWELVGLTASFLAGRLTDLALRYRFFRFQFSAWSRQQGAARTAIPLETRRSLIRFCWQSSLLLVIHAVVRNRSEIFFLERFCDIREVSYYSLGFNLLDKTLLVAQILSTAAGASLMVQFGRDPASVGRVTGTTLRYVALLSLPLALGLGAVSSPLVRTLYGPQYVAAIVPMVVQAALCFPKAVMLPAQQLLIATDNQGFLVKWGLLAAAVNIGLDFWWIPGGGALGAALANGVAQALAAAGVWWFAVRRFRVPVPLPMLAKVAAASLLMVAAAAGISRVLPPAPALAVAVPAGAAVFLLALRALGALDRQDVTRLRALKQQLPGALGSWYEAALQMMAGRAAVPGNGMVAT